MLVDFHIHSKYSDGLLGMKEIVSSLKKNNIKIFSITDHDSVAGIKEAIKVAKKYSMDFIPGIEISCDFEDKEVHLLGYNIDYENSKLLSMLDEMKEKRRERAEKIIRQLQDKSLLKEDSYGFFKEEGVIGRPFIADLLIKEKVVNSRKEAFNKYLNEGMPGWVGRQRPEFTEALALIQQAGGIGVLAHPALSFLSPKLDQLVALGLDGIEVWHPDHNMLITDFYFRYAQENDLIKTGGTDWHGDKDYSTYNHLKMTNEEILQIKDRLGHS